MKLLSINDMYFNLPDDFSGTKPDALRLLADYIESDTPYLTTKCVLKIEDDPWAAYMETIDMGGKVSGTFGLKHYDGTDWKDINK